MKLGCLSIRTRLLITASLLVVAVADASAGDPVAAEALFQQGKQLVAERKYAEACPKYDASYKLDPTLGTLLNLADCYEKAGRIATSWSTWGAAMEQAQRDKDPRLDYAKERREALFPRLPKVVVRVYNAVPGIDVLWDGAKLAPGAFGSEMPTDPLDHKLVVRRDDGVVLFEKTVRVTDDGKKTEIPLDMVALNRAHPRRSADDDSSSAWGPQRKAGLVVGGIGLAALLTAGGLELGALLKRDEANEANACVDGFCTPKGMESIQAARTYAEAGQWIGLGGIIAFSVGATLFFAAPSTSPASPGASKQTANGRRVIDRHRILSPSAVWVSPWAGPTGGGFVFGGKL